MSQKRHRTHFPTDFAHAVEEYAYLSREIAGLLDQVAKLEVQRDHIRVAINQGDFPAPLPARLVPLPKGHSRALLEVAQAVHDLGGEATNGQIMGRLGITRNQAALRLARAVRVGLLVRAANGIYRYVQ